jgi:hypothetical protein
MKAESKIDDLYFALDHWIAVADKLKQQREQAERERDEWKSKYLDEAAAHDKTRRAWGEEAADMTRNAMRDGSEFVSERDALRAERDALRKDAARLDWMADTVAIEAFGTDDVEAHFGCVGMDVYEHASIVADERGNDDDPTASDQREGFRRMIDAAMEATP